MANGGTTLRVALGDYPHTLPLKRGEITSPWLKLEFVEVPRVDERAAAKSISAGAHAVAILFCHVWFLLGERVGASRTAYLAGAERDVWPGPWQATFPRAAGSRRRRRGW